MLHKTWPALSGFDLLLSFVFFFAGWGRSRRPNVTPPCSIVRPQARAAVSARPGASFRNFPKKSERAQHSCKTPGTNRKQLKNNKMQSKCQTPGTFLAGRRAAHVEQSAAAASPPKRPKSETQKLEWVDDIAEHTKMHRATLGSSRLREERQNLIGPVSYNTSALRRWGRCPVRTKRGSKRR